MAAGGSPVAVPAISGASRASWHRAEAAQSAGSFCSALSYLLGGSAGQHSPNVESPATTVRPVGIRPCAVCSPHRGTNAEVSLPLGGDRGKWEGMASSRKRRREEADEDRSVPGAIVRDDLILAPLRRWRQETAASWRVIAPRSTSQRRPTPAHPGNIQARNAWMSLP
jgi:hypothetical protein